MYNHIQVIGLPLYAGETDVHAKLQSSGGLMRGRPMTTIFTGTTDIQPIFGSADIASLTRFVLLEIYVIP